MVRAGISPMEAIVAATVTAAEHIGQSASLGRIEAGKAADVIAVARDPLDDISALLDVAFVMRDGRVFKHGHA
jgi:imidazolonepropionase-like amidohydrolase